MKPDQPRSRRARLACAAFCSLVGGLLLLALQMPTWSAELAMSTDLFEQIAGARECLGGLGCDMRLSLGGPHGAGLPHFLTGLFFFGGDIDDLRLVLPILLALAFALLVATVAFILGARLAGLMVAFVTANLGAYLILFHELPRRLDLIPVPASFAAFPFGFTVYNTNLVPLFAFLFVAGACLYLVDRRPSHLAIAALGAGLAPSFHIVCLLLWGGVGVLVLHAKREHLLRDGATAGMVLLFAMQLTYPTVPLDELSLGMLGGADLFYFGGWRSPAVALLPYSILFGLAALSLRGPGSAGERRIAFFFLVTHAPFIVLLEVLAPEDTRFRYGLWPGLMVLLSITAARLTRLVASYRGPVSRMRERGLMLGIVAVMALMSASTNFGMVFRMEDTQQRGLRYEDLSAAAAHLGELGWTLDDLVVRIRGNEFLPGRDVQAAMAIHEHLLSRESGAAPPSDHVELMLVETTRLRGPLPPGWERVRERDGSSLIVRSFSSTLDWDEFVLCELDEDATAECNCHRLLRRPPDHSHLQDRERLLHKVVSSTETQPGQGKYIAARVPVRVQAGQGPREVIVPSQSWFYPCGGALLAMEGIEVEESLPGAQVTLPDGPAAGALLLAWDVSSPYCLDAGGPVDLPALLDREPDVIEVKTSTPPEALTSERFIERARACLAVRPEPVADDHHRYPTYPLPLKPWWYICFIMASFGAVYLFAWARALRSAHRGGGPPATRA